MCLRGVCARAKSLQSCPTLCDSMDCSLQGSSIHGDSPGKNTGVGCHALLQRILPTQGMNLHFLLLLHCRQILHCQATREAPYLSHGLCLVAQSCPTLQPHEL